VNIAAEKMSCVFGFTHDQMEGLMADQVSVMDAGYSQQGSYQFYTSETTVCCELLLGHGRFFILTFMRAAVLHSELGNIRGTRSWVSR